MPPIEVIEFFQMKIDAAIACGDRDYAIKMGRLYRQLERYLERYLVQP